MSPRTLARLPTVLLLPLTACGYANGTATVEGSGAPAAETREVSEFRSVSFALPGTLFLEQGDVPSLRIEGDDNVLAHVVTRVRDGDLRIAPEENTTLRPGVELRVHVTAPALEAIRNAGTGRVEAPELESETLDATVVGSGSAVVRVRDRITANLLGSGSVSYTGAPEVTSRAMGSGRVNRLDP